jgi:UDP-N-acetylmuramate dehydrogenase
VTPLALATELLGPLARTNVALGPLTTYHVGGPAALFVEAQSVDALRGVAKAVAASDVPVFVLGRGSNLLVADRGFDGLVVALGPSFGTIAVEGTEVSAGAAVLLPVLARQTVAHALTGLEWAVGVPGSVGGAVRMNAGGHGSDVAASLAAVHVVDLRSGDDREVAAADLHLGFRRSDLTEQQVVTAARFALAEGRRDEGEALLAEIVRWRREHQPGGQNCGSVFVNPVPGEVAAGELIDELGLRGLRIGTARVSEKHANFIQADEGGRAADVVAVMEHVRRRVLEATGYALRSEVRLVGFPAPGEGS